MSNVKRGILRKRKLLIILALFLSDERGGDCEMSKMWKELLKLSAEIQQSYGEELKAGASAEAIQDFAAVIKRDFGIDLSPEYLEFLSYADGYDFNGYIILGTANVTDDFQNMIEFNTFIRKNENLKRYWFYGTGSLSWYVYDIEKNKYLDIDASEEIMAQFDTFGELMAWILGESLGVE